ncbi:ATP synthase subunit e, mitochondrial-like [Chionomys nivalis]|uniref:ATP synthase subunit e, mitochondrial-like n=1 Tax=Chionomys nivalis TaxID=269649 RepID=UPI002599B1E5|nr:ATP synthase subunit e, mitochondrial-like [Chionomys nivalis]
MVEALDAAGTLEQQKRGLGHGQDGAPVQVSPLIKLGRYSALVLGMAYGAKHYSYLKPRAEERGVAAEEERLDELNRIERERAEAQGDSILK